MVNSEPATPEPAPAPPARWLRSIERVTFASFLLSLLLGMLVPIYTDEVGWRMQLRAGIDGGVDRLLSDICGPNTIAAPPLFIMPVRAMSAWFNLTFPDPFYVRIISVACAIGWAFLLRALIGRLATSTGQRSLLRTLAFGLLGMGVLPLMLIMSRPDQAVLIAMTATLFVAVYAARRTDETDRLALLWPFVIAALGLVAISYHLKGILIAPLILVCIFFAGSGRRTLPSRIVAILMFAALAAQGAHYWTERLRCPDDPVLAEKLAKQNIASALANEGDWRNLTMTALKGANPNNYIILAEARRFPMSNWLPQGKIDGETALLRFTAMGLAWNLAIIIALVCLIRTVRTSWRERRLALTTAVPIVLAGLAMIWGISQRIRNDYEIMTVLPMLALFCLFSLAGIAWSPLQTRRLRIITAAVAVFSMAGQLDIALRYYPSLRAASAQAGYIEGQPFSASAYGYGPLRGKILETARLCHIGSSGRAQRPLVDDVTYFALTDSWRPFHRFGVLDTWNGSIRDPLAYLKAKGSEGVIVGCRNLSPELRQKAIQNGEFCCISTR